MLEEARMDKKSLNRSSLQQSRTTSIDCKKSTDLTHKPLQRNSKKREAPNFQKNEPSRRNVAPQRGRGQIDRRQCNRGASSSFVGGTENTGVDEDEEPEIGSVLVPGSKKQNLNHLLNFMYPSRGGPERRNYGAVPRRQAHRVSYKHEHDLYLRAYCQFVVKEDGDYRGNLLDPDLPVKWEQIEEIVVRSTGRSECPICLGAPVAGRVGHCGHVYCWACMLHYASTHDKQPPPCPVCATPIQVSEMKPTKIVQWESPADEVTMRLVRRLRGSSIVEIAPSYGQITDIQETNILPLSSLNESPYAKLFTASKQQVFEILDRERKELETQILAEIDTTEVVYLEQALEILKTKEEKIKSQYEQPNIVQNEPSELSPIVIEKQDMSNNAKLDWFDVSEEGAACAEVQHEMAQLNFDSKLNPDAESFDINDNRIHEFPLTECFSPEIPSVLDNAKPDIYKENQAKYFYFYQAEDGQQVFLNSLNVRTLNASWGTLAASPAIIRGRVLHRETQSLNDQTRKHMPYTAHLPLHCSFDIVELELQPPYVTVNALNNFGAEIQRRARLRARHERDERRRERAWRRAMEGPPKPDFFSDVQFPPAQNTYGSPPNTDVMTFNQFEDVNPPEAVLTPPPLEQTSSTAPYASPPSSGLSFAKMASTSGTWRVRKAAVAPPPPPDDDEDGGGPRGLVLSDAIEAALRNVPSATAKKNKKSKPKLLFATGMQHSA